MATPHDKALALHIKNRKQYTSETNEMYSKGTVKHSAAFHKSIDRQHEKKNGKLYTKDIPF